jgi:chemosensory pili system protein ChpA (sensor histidine kinase/response regulator)
MDRPVNPGIASAFIAEALSYLPKILEALEVNGQGSSDRAALEEAHRLVHTIRGAAAIVGFQTVSDRAATVESELETVVNTEQDLSADDAKRLQFMVCEIGAEVDRIAAESLPSDLPSEFDESWGEPDSDGATVGDASFDLSAADEELIADETALVDDGSFGEEDNIAPAAAARASAHATDELPVDDEVPAELMDVFVVEAADHLQIISRTLSGLQSAPEDRATLQELRRSVHTLKGAAGMVGFRTVSQLAHRMEDLLDALYDGEVPSTKDTTAVLFAGADSLHHLVTGEGDQEAIRAGIPALYARLTAALKGDAAGAAAAPAASAPTPAAPRSQKSSTAGHALPIAPTPSETPSKSTGTGAGAAKKRGIGPKRSTGESRRNKQRQNVRVGVERLDELINLVGEMVINRSAFQQYLTNISRELQELGQSVTRLRLLWSKLETEYEVGAPMGRTGKWAGNAPSPSEMSKPDAAAAHGFDELEWDQYTESHLLSRQLSETVGDIDAVSRQLHESITSFEGDFSRMKRLTTDAQDRLLRLRMVPIGTQATKLERIVRMTAEQRGKQVDFTLEGEGVALDRPILDEVSEALLHLLRNAVDHGVEAPDVREKNKKSPRAKVTVRASYEGAHAIIQVSDDGRGLNFARMRDVAVRDGFLLPEDAAVMTERDLQALIFRPKFSTASEISEVSGRGVGLDVVKDKILQLNGTVSVASVPGNGATFTLRLPLTLAVARVLLVKAGGQTFALPAPTISRVLRVDREEVEEDGEVREVGLEGVQYRAFHVLKALGQEQRPEDATNRVSALILASPDNPAAVIVDQFLEARDVVVTMLTGHLRKVRGVSGATVLGDGQVVVILNPDELLSQLDAATQRVGQPAARQMVTPIDHATRTLRILVVDDSLSVRQVLANLVRRVGWTPLVARDGLEALETLQRESTLPDLIFSDVEMPRMDGYELTSTVKADPKMKRVPVVFITSRAGDKHRRRGFEVGAAGYLVKPFDEQALLTLVARLTGVQPDRGLASADSGNAGGGASGGPRDQGNASTSMTERGASGESGEQVS